MTLRSEWSEKAIVPALSKYMGWVYAFYGDKDFPIYVGEIGRTFRRRFTDHNNNTEQRWWPSWTRVKVLPGPNKSVRKLFESLIGLAGEHAANIIQPAEEDNIFDEVLLSLLQLRNDHKSMPTFPNQMLFDQRNSFES